MQKSTSAILATLMLWSMSMQAVAMERVHAQQLYLDFESSLHGNDAAAAALWLSEQYQLEQQQALSGFAEEKRTLSRERVLVNIEQNAYAKEVASIPANVQVVTLEPEYFCVEAQVEGETQKLGRTLWQHISRNACFSLQGSQWQVVEHRINTTLFLAKPPQDATAFPAEG